MFTVAQPNRRVLVYSERLNTIRYIRDHRGADETDLVSGNIRGMGIQLPSVSIANDGDWHQAK